MRDASRIDSDVDPNQLIVSPKDDVALYFRFNKLNAPKHSTLASMFTAKELLASPILKQVWRVSFSKDDLEVSPKRALYFSRSALKVSKDAVMRLI